MLQMMMIAVVVTIIIIVAVVVILQPQRCQDGWSTSPTRTG